MTSRPKRTSGDAKFARSFEYYVNPGKEAILAMRRAYFLRGENPAETLERWLSARDNRDCPDDFELSPAAKRAFLRLKAERDAIGIIEHTGDIEKWTRSTLWCAMHVVAVQAVDPWWRGVRIEDIALPNLVDWAYVSDRSGEFYAACWEAMSNVSYLIAVVGDDRLGDYSKPFYKLDEPRSHLTGDVMARMECAGMPIHQAVSDVLGQAGYTENSREYVDIMEDLETIGVYSKESDMHAHLRGVSGPSMR